ncbi:MAG TPA: DISARM system SNF2-like helicase DrmD, partial [Chloroflexota bacterium]|nr:DISARM system SNF2-like helicase DrmD [Chloroflexota bacterium]
MAVPSVGQLVEVRRRPFVVQDVIASGLPRDVLRPGGQEPVQHLVSLSSIEDDALGEELRVVWEIEPGARIYETQRLPDPTKGFDEPQRLDAFLDAVLWGAISSADITALQAPFRSGIAIEDYQLDPVVRAIQMPRANLLVADDVGLGKTIEAGLVAQELILRQRVHTVLIACPSSLQIQWRDQMRDKFGLEFRIVDTALMKELRRSRGLRVNPWTHFPRLITSIDYLKRDRPLRLLREVLPAPGKPIFPRTFDLLIVDEAHNVAPSGSGRYATDSDRTHAIRLLVPHFEHKLFLTATPHNGYPESFASLLEMLDNQRFARGVRPDPEQLAAVMVRRLKTDIVDWDGTPRFPKRILEAIEVPYTAAERQAHHLLHAYTESRHKRASGETERFATEFVLKLLKKRLFSSPAAFASTLAKHEETVRTALRKPRHQRAVPSLGVLRRQAEGVEEEFGDDDAYAESADEALAAATTLFAELTDQEEGYLRELRIWAQAAAARPDSKAAELIRWLNAAIKPGGAWADQRVIIFTEYRDTQKWLMQLLTAHGFGGADRLLTMYGGMETEDRERIKAAFQAGPDQSWVRILLATDAASEGIDLQNHCSRLIHYEIPWNPNRMEQRNGRI